MNKKNGYSEVDYETLVGNLYDAYKRSGKTYMDIAYCLKLGSTQTVGHALKRKKQVVSDKMLTKIMEFFNVNGYVNWESGFRTYYLKNGK